MPHFPHGELSPCKFLKALQCSAYAAMSDPSPYETAVKAVEDAQKAFNDSIKIVVQSIGQGAASANSLAQEGYALASDVIGQGQVGDGVGIEQGRDPTMRQHHECRPSSQFYVDHGVDKYKQLEDQAFATAIGAWCGA
jgi:hypothetical protein